MLEVLHDELVMLKNIEAIPNYIHGWEIWVGLTHQTNIPLDNMAFVGD